MNMHRLTPPPDCDDLGAWLCSVVYDAIRDAKQAGLSDSDASVLLNIIARYNRPEPRRRVDVCEQQVDCAGWPRWVQLCSMYESGGVAYFEDDEDDGTIESLLREWSFNSDDTEDDEPSAPTWVMFPDHFIDPSTLCTAELT